MDTLGGKGLIAARVVALHNFNARSCPWTCLYLSSHDNFILYSLNTGRFSFAIAIMHLRLENKCYLKGDYLSISKLHLIVSVAILFAHNNISPSCYCGQISLQSAAVSCIFFFRDNLTHFWITFILLWWYMPYDSRGSDSVGKMLVKTSYWHRIYLN